MNTTDVIASLALFFSVVSFVISLWHQWTMAKVNSRLQEAMFDMDRDTQFEGRLAEWPEAFQFYGIDLETARKEGVSAQQIAYLILSVNAMTYACSAIGRSVYEHLTSSDYRQRMFSHAETRKAWKFARSCIPKASGEQIDRYITERFPDVYEPF